ncbi:MAG: ABC transporter ATP-binding protein [Proteobacteria bacterium]|nr:ABC transporter ATP-binding protein [Pseudomonadota bacterium]
MARLQLKHLSKRYGEVDVVRDLSFEVADGEFVVLLGPSGCGKTTTLRMIAGFVSPSEGEVWLGPRDITRQPPWRRNAGLVFQSYALFPHLSVTQNVAFGLEMRKLAAAEVSLRVAEALKLVRLEGYEQRLPRELSGGQQQRVALARALAIQPDVLLLDEPLSNLDAKLRQDVRIEIRELQKRLRLTTVMVTHDQDEALAIADRLVVMEGGRVRQIGSQRELYERPADRFVAGFVGRSTFLAGAITLPGQFMTKGGIVIRCAGGTPGAAVLALRPEHLSLASERLQGMENCLSGVVDFVSYLGAVLDVRVRLSPSDTLLVTLPNRDGGFAPAEGSLVFVGWPPHVGLVYADGDDRVPGDSTMGRRSSNNRGGSQ